MAVELDWFAFHNRVRETIYEIVKPISDKIEDDEEDHSKLSKFVDTLSD
jgi:CRISPR/Cas system CSM-associated protein Csm2 small subunit